MEEEGRGYREEERLQRKRKELGAFVGWREEGRKGGRKEAYELDTLFHQQQLHPTLVSALSTFSRGKTRVLRDGSTIEYEQIYFLLHLDSQRETSYLVEPNPLFALCNISLNPVFPVVSGDPPAWKTRRART